MEDVLAYWFKGLTLTTTQFAFYMLMLMLCAWLAINMKPPEV